MIQPKLTLGALYRCLLDRLDTRLGVRVEIHFEERTSVVVEHAAAGTEAERIDQRTFDAELAVRDERVAEATLTAGATETRAPRVRPATASRVPVRHPVHVVGIQVSLHG